MGYKLNPPPPTPITTPRRMRQWAGGRVEEKEAAEVAIWHNKKSRVIKVDMSEAPRSREMQERRIKKRGGARSKPQCTGVWLIDTREYRYDNGDGEEGPCGMTRRRRTIPCLRCGALVSDTRPARKGALQEGLMSDGRSARVVLMVQAHLPVRKPIRLVYEGESRSGRPHCQAMRSGGIGWRKGLVYSIHFVWFDFFSVRRCVE